MFENGRESVYHTAMPKRIDFEAALSKFRDFYSTRRRLPSFSEIQELFGYKSKGGVSVLVRNLVERGIIEQDPTGRLLPGASLERRLKLLGSVQAGFPSPEQEQELDDLSLDDFLVKKPEATFLVKVSGDSMIDAGIRPGDLVLVERGREAMQGDIVIARVDGEWTLKYFEKRNGKPFLRAANKKYPEIFPKSELETGGVVIGCVRKYR